MPVFYSLRPASVLLFIVCLLASSGFAQGTDPTYPRDLEYRRFSYRTAPGTCVIVFEIFAERSGALLDRQAVLKLVNTANHSFVWQTTDDRALGSFTDLAYGKYEVEVSAVGYLSAHKELNIVDSTRPTEVSIVLQRDPSAINLDIAATVMSPKARKEAKRAIARLKSGNLVAAQKQLDQAYKLAPSSSEVNFLLGYLFFQKRDLTQASRYLGAATTLNPHNGQALTLLGRTELEREDYPAARSALEQAVLADADNWLPHSLLADAYLHQSDYEKAREEAEIAIDKGKSNALPAHIVLGEALVGLGREQEGIQTLNEFLQESPHDPVADQVRSFIAAVEKRPPAASRAQPAISEIAAAPINPLAGIPAPLLAIRSWRPPGIDDVKPPTVPNTSCPTAQVIGESGKRVEELVRNVARFAAVEDLLHQSLDRYGIPVRTETRKYNYVASISELSPGILDVEEYRADKITVQDYPDQIASTGFAVLALIFHPYMRDDFEITCEGLGDWHGQASWLVHFRQRDDRPNRMQGYKVGSQIYGVALKGRAWITADKFEVVRIEADMVKPMPEIQLLSEHQIVEYGPVPFPKKDTTLWLPKTAELYFDFRKHHYYRRHSFDHYMLFAVDTQEKTKEPSSKSGHADHSM